MTGFKGKKFDQLRGITKHGPPFVDQVHRPGHQNMDRVHGPLFLLPLKYCCQQQ